MPLSTHVLDIARGVPAADMEISLSRIDGTTRTQVAVARTDADGRIAAPFGGDLTTGTYELVFHAGAYFARHGITSLYTDIPVRFRLSDAAAKYHIPLLLSPWGYSTYRGS